MFRKPDAWKRTKGVFPTPPMNPSTAREENARASGFARALNAAEKDMVVGWKRALHGTRAEGRTYVLHMHGITTAFSVAQERGSQRRRHREQAPRCPTVM